MSAMMPQKDFTGVHTALLGLLDETLNSLSAGSTRAEFARNLERLRAQAQEHFLDQERVFNLYGKDEQHPHCLAHQSLLDYMSELAEGTERWEYPLLLIRLRILDHSLTAHINQEQFQQVVCPEVVVRSSQRVAASFELTL